MSHTESMFCLSLVYQIQNLLPENNENTSNTLKLQWDIEILFMRHQNSSEKMSHRTLPDNSSSDLINGQRPSLDIDISTKYVFVRKHAQTIKLYARH